MEFRHTTAAEEVWTGLVGKYMYGGLIGQHGLRIHAGHSDQVIAPETHDRRDIGPVMIHCDEIGIGPTLQEIPVLKRMIGLTNTSHTIKKEGQKEYHGFHTLHVGEENHSHENNIMQSPAAG
jgi:hypothetical protein